jgi:type VI secretion system protein ImpB
MAMAQDQSVAPKERINITYKPATGNQQAEEELPLKLLVVSDFTGKPDERPMEQRTPVNIDKDNFQEVLAKHDVSVSFKIPNPLSSEKGAELPINLKFRKLSDFTPDAVAAQIDELKDLLALRAELTALKGPMGNVGDFRRAVEGLLKDPTRRDRALAELTKLGLVKEEG